MVTRASRAGLLGATLLALLVAPATAQPQVESPYKITVDGLTEPVLRARPRAFMAVRVLVENDSARKIESTLRIYHATGPDKPAAQQSLFYERRVSVPRSGKRTETVYYYVQENEPGRQLCVQFQPDDNVTAPGPVFPKLE